MAPTRKAAKKVTPAKKAASGTRTSGGDRAPAKKRTAATTRRGTRTVKRDSCFVISPFGPYFDRYYEEVFVAAIEEAELSPKRADDLFRSSDIVRDVWHLISTSRVMLAELTGKNPNVFYELGLAHAAKKPVLLVSQTIDDVPFDLRGLRVITYDIREPHWAKKLHGDIVQGLAETLESPERSVLPPFLAEAPQDQVSATPSEKRLLELEGQLETLRAQVRSLGSSSFASTPSYTLGYGGGTATVPTSTVFNYGRSVQSAYGGTSSSSPVEWVSVSPPNFTYQPMPLVVTSSSDDPTPTDEEAGADTEDA